jgi:hypothetical protein
VKKGSDSDQLSGIGQGSGPQEFSFQELKFMQNAKDSFYMALRTRLTTINPERTILLRGAVRPGIWWRKRKRRSTSFPTMCLCCAGWAWAWIWIWRRRWRPRVRDSLPDLRDAEFRRAGPRPALSEMDEELTAMLQPFYTPKLNYTATPPAAMLTQVFWDEPGFGRL